jgi:glycerophosphoryl diester phosphodiesterase
MSLATEVVRLTRDFDMIDRVVVESFEHSAIAAVKQIDSGLRTAALFEPKFTRPVLTLRRQKLVAAAVAITADEIALHHKLASLQVVKKAREVGLDVVVWTVDDPVWIKRADSLGIKALIANDPGFMVQCRNKNSGSDPVVVPSSTE